MKGLISFSARRGLLPAAVVLLAIYPCRSADLVKEANDAKAAILVRQALENELAGHNDQRESLLQSAVKQSPDYSPAQWQSGKVWDKDKKAWLAPAEIETAAQRDKRLAEYRKRRDAVGPTLAEQVALAHWCRKSKLDDEERVHWLFVLQIQPNHSEAVQRLGLHEYKGMMLTNEQIEQCKAQWEKHARTLEKWQLLAADWQAALERGESSPPDEVRKQAVNVSTQGEMLALQKAIRHEAGGKKEKLHGLTLSLAKTQIDNPHPAAAESLTHLAIYSPWDDVRTAAVEGLKKHPLDHFAPYLLGLLQTPYEADIRFNLDANGNLISRTNIYREGALADNSSSQTMTPISSPPLTNPEPWDKPGDVDSLRKYLGHNARAYLDAHPEIIAPWQKDDITEYVDEAFIKPRLQAAMIEALRRQNAAMSQTQAAQQANALHEMVEQANRDIGQNNARVIAVLRETTGLELDELPTTWWKWWLRDHNDSYLANNSSAQNAETDPDPYDPDTNNPVYEYETSRRYFGNTPVAYVPQFVSTIPLELAKIPSCFAPDTKIWTLTGRMPIGKIKVGDRVLSQNAETGELAYKPVLEVTIRPPHRRMKIDLGAESIFATPGHPFWVDGKAWQLTKQLEAGRLLHSISGGVPIESIEKVEADLSWDGYSYNLVVADFGSYFIGEQGILVHDNSPRSPTAARIPGLPAETISVAEK